MQAASLVSADNRVESPFIIANIGGSTFGNCSDMSSKQRLFGSVTYPNYMQSIQITKIDGAVNTYVLKMEYAITEKDDPNLLEKVFSSVSNTREITLSYGDWNTPSHIYKEEKAIITKVSSNVDFQSSKIIYTVSAVSTALTLTAGSFSFNSRTAKGSDVLKELFNNTAYGMQKIFSGMSNRNLSTLIAGDDRPVKLEAKKSTNILDYTNYVVGCMQSQSDTSNGVIKDSNYHMSIYDDTTSYGGSYFKVVKVPTNASAVSTYDTYEVDVGYPSENCVMSFNINTDNTWAILYEHSGAIQQPQYTYSINSSGNIVSSPSSVLTRSSTHLKTTASDKTWWTQLTQFPISAQLTLKGLLRPTLLMTYVKVNAYFYGQKHISSGLYIITKQVDTIDSSGYRTTLSLTRIEEDG